MIPPLRIALIGERDPAVTAHRAIPEALALAGAALALEVQGEWLATDRIVSQADLDGYDAFWCVPASPYVSEAGALRAIRHARVGGLPFLGTCGGFQYAVLEYARNVLGWGDAGHAELDANATNAVIVPLLCALVETRGALRLVEGSRLARSYGMLTIQEGYHCSYGPSAAFAAALADGPLRVTATDEAGDPRAVELNGHPFFVGTLFQPERRALTGETPPPVLALVEAAAAGRG